MNSARIKQALNDIEFYEKALKWLEEYGHQLEGKDAAKITVDIHAAGACPGSAEAAMVLASYAKHELPNIVKISIQSCRNTIVIATDAIREEAAK